MAARAVIVLVVKSRRERVNDAFNDQPRRKYMTDNYRHTHIGYVVNCKLFYELPVTAP